MDGISVNLEGCFVGHGDVGAAGKRAAHHPLQPAEEGFHMPACAVVASVQFMVQAK
jgi:hypothetical protein